MKLAINGGPKVKTTPYNRPNRYGEEEMRQLAEVIEGGSLMYTSGTKVREFEEAVCGKFGCARCLLTTSGTSALHVALAAVGVAEGDEVITTPMSDFGTVIPILAQHAVPVFCDIDLRTRLMDPACAERLITPRTKTIMVVHMAGLVADMDAFMRLGEKHGVAIIEDCSQCHMGLWKGSPVGTIGRVGAFSMNESKHMSTGDGGFITTDDPEVARIARLFTDKTYQRDASVPRGQEPLSFLGMNYRPNCLSAAVALAQLGKLDRNLRRRREIADRYYRELGDLPHFELPTLIPETLPAWWPVPARYTGESPTRNELAGAIEAEGIWLDTGMSPANNMLRTQLMQTRRFYPLTDRIPAFWRDTVYNPDSCPNVDELQRTVLRLPVDQRYNDEDITQTIQGYRKVWGHFFG